MFEKIKQELEKYEGLHYITEELSNYRYDLDNLHKFGMVLLGPDSFMQSETLRIIDFYEKRGFELVDVCVKRLNRTMTENLFLPTSTCTKCGDLKWWMIQDSAKQGAFGVALLYCDDADIEDNCLKRLNAYKGMSNPLDNSTGVVRFDYEAINVCLNLIHIPDSYGDFFKDILPFYKIKELVDIIQDRTMTKQFLDNKLFEIKLMLRTGEKYIFEKVLYKTKFNIACLLKDEKELLDYYKNQYKWFSDEKSREKRNTKLKENIRYELERIRNLEYIFLNQIRSENDIERVFELINKINILRILNLFTSPCMYKVYERDLYNELRGYGLVIEEFEVLILNTSLIQWID